MRRYCDFFDINISKNYLSFNNLNYNSPTMGSCDANGPTETKLFDGYPK